ncbi:putative integral membrane protein (TIGR00698 family) [Mesonia algae]|uniref:Putative integral membrane protein (TIGR00698 family) n=1 Tax=Mesonia algae TaxID=213248 RepID=A0A2W7I160_9FLAO|nr:putative sulfate exporter family transporter [Mesonia algae]PZW39172.1 putative integral membrane protein (TIGR00698 family) [Mesonia algae]
MLTKLKPIYIKAVFIIAAILCLTSFVSSPIALLMGFLLTNLLYNPFPNLSRQIVKWLLKLSVIGLGFGMDLNKSLEVGKEGLLLTIITISSTLILGYFIGKALKLDRVISYLIASGTAICGGSAIAAVSAVIKAKEKEISIALGVVFFLNALAIFVFPLLGHQLDLSQKDFGLWSAIAIHDTSSVVGAALAYGEEALDIAVTVKLSRALWIIPLSIFSMFLFKGKANSIKIPWFILLFVIAVIANSYLNLPDWMSFSIPQISKQLLILTLFLVGAGLTFTSIKESGAKPIILGVSLWVIISIVSLVYIMYFI